MPVITYTAVNRGFLASGHSATLQYQIENAFEAFPLTFNGLGNFRTTLNGTPESYLYAVQRRWDITTDLIYAAALPLWDEFFTSVLAKETFQVDFTGTIASPGTNVNVYLEGESITRSQLHGNNARYQFAVVNRP